MLFPENKKVFFICAVALAFVCGTVAWMHKRPSLNDMVGQIIMTGFHGDGMGENADDFAAIESQIQDGVIGGIILFDVDISGLLARGMTMEQAKQQIFSSNIKNIDQVKNMVSRLQKIAPKKLLVAVDQEGGNIQRLKPEHGFASIPSAAQLGRGDTNTTYEIAYDLGSRLHDLGINMDFAPLLDVNVNPESPAIGAKERSFSDDPETVATFGGAFARGLADAGIAYSFKHFPGHGSAGTDSHNGITDITNTYQEYELEPWRELLSDNDVRTTVMVAHVINNNFDNVPASLSGKTISMLRDMGFDGVIVSDDMDMGAIANEYGLAQAIKMALDAGNDVLVFGNNLTFDRNRGRDVHGIIMHLVDTGQIKKSRIRESYNRIMRLKKHI